MRGGMYFAGGSNSPITYFENYPVCASRAQGPYIFSPGGKRYIDLWSAYGALLFGHADPVVTRAIVKQSRNGVLYPLSSNTEAELAKRLVSMIPCAERVKIATTGSEATMYAARIARAYTGRDRILGITGNYHGGNDSLMKTRGIPSGMTSLVERVNFNDLAAAQVKLETNMFSAMILEPVMTNSGCILPGLGYLSELRKMCTRTGSLLIFDEVVTGFRLGAGGAQEMFGVTPDLAIFSKVLGGGLPISAVCGRSEVMDLFTPGGDVFFGGTFHANPLAVAAALSVLARIDSREVRRLNRETDRLVRMVEEDLESLQISARVSHLKSMFTIFFSKTPIESASQSGRCDLERHRRFAINMIKKDVFIPPSQFETCFLSTPCIEIIDRIASRIREALKSVQGRRLP